MVNICDVMMGGGKSSATITYINEHPEKRFLYITPYLDEAKRINRGCPDAHFVEPDGTDNRYWTSKSRQSMEFIEQGRNIASTHAALRFYSKETYEMLREKNYCVIIDEEIEVLQKAPSMTFQDISLIEAGGYIEAVGDFEYRRTDKKYDGGRFTDLLHLMGSRSIVSLEEWKKGKRIQPWYWIFSTMLFEYVEDIFVLTYMFKGSEMNYFFDMYDIPYRSIGVVHEEDGTYRFSDEPTPLPEYTKNLSKLIHISMHEKMNNIGKNRNACSMNWYVNHEEEAEQMRRNVDNFFRHRTQSLPEERMCGMYKAHWDKIKGKGYMNNFAPFNLRATNNYRHCTKLAYPVNLFPNADTINFYRTRGIEYDKDHYALSTMVQWIWRSAIRDGKEIEIYLPSRRMRELLIGWIKEVERR